ncbi:restriction endonuclease subunit S [Parabacteroides sp. PF5-9]|uniref:restriction endonuclease subunit S n=1 Tax=Parabacteroides sp. PF5-9 TaxID=1742404 RepID=UPI0024771662|nr:restriction endonuclease subunit S [Parabacteroides sp. PF5-9]MDH6357344.1 type I restriction enzyme S subunit [Parabacteroides sp. PF5-9]
MNYKRLGDYIREVDVRNEDDSITNLLGINIDKYYMPSVANVVGTDLSRYKVVEKGQFACNRMHVGRDKRLPVALSIKEDRFIVSPAYDVFEIIDKKELLPEYLMMWFSRKEFDRNTWFYTDADVRGGLNWNTFLDMQLPIPSPEKQREIVAEYNAVQRRIDLNNQLIQKLEETAQTIYKQWFVEDQNCDFKTVEIGNFGNVVTGKTPSSECPEDFGNNIPFITPGDFKNYNKFALGAERNLSEIGYIKLKNKILPKGSVIVTCIGSDMGKVAIAFDACITNQQMNSIIVDKSYYSDFLYYYLISISKEIKGIAMGGSTMPMLSKSDFEKIELLKPLDETLIEFEKVMSPINEMNILYSNENYKLSEMSNLLLSKMVTIEN